MLIGYGITEIGKGDSVNRSLTTMVTRTLSYRKYLICDF